jgi:hypothetical protein
MHIGIFIILLIVTLALSLVFFIAQVNNEHPPKSISLSAFLLFLLSFGVLCGFINSTKVILGEYYSESEIKDGVLTDVILYTEDLTDDNITIEQNVDIKTAELHRVNLNKLFSRDFEPGTKFERFYHRLGWLYDTPQFKEVTE